MVHRWRGGPNILWRKAWMIDSTTRDLAVNVFMPDTKGASNAVHILACRKKCCVFSIPALSKYEPINKSLKYLYISRSSTSQAYVYWSAAIFLLSDATMLWLLWRSQDSVPSESAVDYQELESCWQWGLFLRLHPLVDALPPVLQGRMHLATWTKSPLFAASRQQWNLMFPSKWQIHAWKGVLADSQTIQSHLRESHEIGLLVKQMTMNVQMTWVAQLLRQQYLTKGQ